MTATATTPRTGVRHAVLTTLGVLIAVMGLLAPANPAEAQTNRTRGTFYETIHCTVNLTNNTGPGRLTYFYGATPAFDGQHIAVRHISWVSTDGGRTGRYTNWSSWDMVRLSAGTSGAFLAGTVWDRYAGTVYRPVFDAQYSGPAFQVWVHWEVLWQDRATGNWGERETRWTRNGTYVTQPFLNMGGDGPGYWQSTAGPLNTSAVPSGPCISGTGRPSWCPTSGPCGSLNLVSLGG